MIKVLMVGNDHSVKGGISSVISQILSHNWVDDGITMTFIPTYVEGGIIRKLLYFLNAYWEICNFIKHDRPNIVHIHMSYKGSFTRKFLIHKLCKKNNIPDIIHLHGSEFQKWYNEVGVNKRKRIRTLLQEANTFIVLGDKWNQIIKKIEPRTNTVVVSNTVHIPCDTVSWKEPFKILYLGVLIKRKGVSDLLEAIKLLKEEFGGVNIKVVIAGSGTEEESLKKKSIELALENIIEFVGGADGEKKKNIILDCQMLVLPSYNEGLPMSILEAMSYGMPIVATDVGDIPSAVIDGVNGYLVKPGRIQDIADSIKRLVADRESYRLFSEASRKMAEEQFDEKFFFKTLRQIYCSLEEKEKGYEEKNPCCYDEPL